MGNKHVGVIIRILGGAFTSSVKGWGGPKDIHLLMRQSIHFAVKRENEKATLGE
jgi:hypothetical protein